MAEREELTPDDALRMWEQQERAREGKARRARRDLWGRIATHAVALAAGLLVGWIAGKTGTTEPTRFEPARAPAVSAMASGAHTSQPTVPASAIDRKGSIQPPRPGPTTPGPVTGEEEAARLPERAVELPAPIPTRDEAPAAVDAWWKELPAKRAWRTPHQIQESTDKFTQRTEIQTPWMFLPGHGLKLLLSKGWPAAGSPRASRLGRNKEDWTVAAMISSSSESWRYLEYHPIYILADGEPVGISEAEHDGKVHTGRVTEYLSFRIPIDSFLQIVRAERVELRVGINETEIHPPALEAARALASAFRDVLENWPR